jgi:hypothetical protein
VSHSLHLRTETDSVSETLRFLVFRLLDAGQSRNSIDSEGSGFKSLQSTSTLRLQLFPDDSHQFRMPNRAKVAQSVQRLSTGCSTEGSGFEIRYIKEI